MGAEGTSEGPLAGVGAEMPSQRLLIPREVRALGTLDFVGSEGQSDARDASASPHS